MREDEVRLENKKCESCHPETPKLEGEELQKFYSQLEKGWELEEEHHLSKIFPFNNFREALDFTNRIGEMSEEEGHHPNIELSWGKVKVTVYTHAIDGLSENDFIWAAKADKQYSAQTV